MRAFLTLWSGQLVSTIGSGMTAFALGLFVYQRTNSTTDFVLIFLSGMLPRALFSPIAGVLADRFNRRALMALSDLGSIAGLLFAIGLSTAGYLEIWHIYLVTGIGAVFSALRVPTYTAIAGSLASKERTGRVGGMIQLSEAVGQVVAPVVAGALVAAFAIKTVLWIDLATFLFSLVTLFVVRIPKLAQEVGEGRSFLDDARAGWIYLQERPGLLGLLFVFVVGNFFIGNAQALLTPLILGFSSAQALGAILSVGGSGMLLGGILMSLWGGGERRVKTILTAYFTLGLGVALAGLTSLESVTGGALFIAYFSLPFVIGTTNAVLISKVAREMQGRVFSLRVALVTLSFALAFVTAGPLADGIFKPAMAPGGPLSGLLGSLIGTGEGRGLGLMFILLGIFAMITAAVAWTFPRLRNLEAEIPDVG
jgi:hypothetical protein